MRMGVRCGLRGRWHRSNRGCRPAGAMLCVGACMWWGVWLVLVVSPLQLVLLCASNTIIARCSMQQEQVQHIRGSGACV